jgi:hypothetical protein
MYQQEVSSCSTVGAFFRMLLPTAALWILQPQQNDDLDREIARHIIILECLIMEK